MASRKIFEIELTGPFGSFPATHRLDESVSFAFDTAKITVYKPGKSKEKRGISNEYNVAIGRKATDPITVLTPDEVGLLAVLVDKAVYVLEHEEA